MCCGLAIERIEGSQEDSAERFCDIEGGSTMGKLTVEPSFGRDYRKNSEAREAWNKGEHFTIKGRIIDIYIHKGEKGIASEIWCLHNKRRTISRIEP